MWREKSQTKWRATLWHGRPGLLPVATGPAGPIASSAVSVATAEAGVDSGEYFPVSSRESAMEQGEMKRGTSRLGSAFPGPGLGPPGSVPGGGLSSSRRPHGERYVLRGRHVLRQGAPSRVRARAREGARAPDSRATSAEPRGRVHRGWGARTARLRQSTPAGGWCAMKGWACFGRLRRTLRVIEPRPATRRVTLSLVPG
jgi:hypothetical protein